MIAFFKRPVVLITIGFVLLALIIFLLGPLVPVFGIYPLASIVVQLELFVAIALVFVGWQVYKRSRAGAASDQLMGEMVDQARRRGGEAAELQRKFEEAAAFLKQNRRKGHSLYDLPWYAIIGAPGAGKTTALTNSGLQFPMEKKAGRRPVKGVGGTRNCDWFFTQEAVLLDTAGRYTTQDADEASDSAAWVEFLRLLKKYRRRRPLNGVLLTVSVRDLVEFDARQLEDYVTAARQRLDELSTELGIPLPVYVLVTKCDLVPGFTEYFSDFTRDGRGQVWGVTFPFDRTMRGDAADLFPEELDALFARLNERLYARLDAEHDPGRRTRVFSFPQELSALREPLGEFVANVFGSTRFDRKVLLRGVYLTSATQHGTSFDRLVGALAEQLALPPAAVAQGSGTGKAFFIEQLLKDVILAESGIAGTNFRLEFRKAAAQLAVYAAIVTVAAVSVVGLAWSYARNRNFTAEVAAEAAPVARIGANGSASLDAVLPRLDAVRRVVDAASLHEKDVPWGMRWGLYQGTSLTGIANDAYQRELQGALLPWLFGRIEQRLTDFGSESELLYGYLKAYLMLTQLPDRLDAQQVTDVAGREFVSAFQNQPEIASALTAHAQAMLAARPVVSSYDASLVARARSSVLQASIPGLVYQQVRSLYADQPPLRVDLKAGVGFDRVFRRKSAKPITTPMPALFTPDVFFDAVNTGIDEATARFAKDQWVWGEGAPPAVPLGAKRQVIEMYEADYIKAWQSLIDDIVPVPAAGKEATVDLLTRLGGQSSPLRGFLQVVDANTFLEPPAAAAGPGGVAGVAAAAAGRAANEATGGLAGRLTGGGSAQAPVTAGARVKEHFAKIHEQVTGAPGSAPIDGTLGILKQMGDVVDKTGSGKVGGMPAAEGAVRLADLQKQLGQAADSLPPSVAAVVSTAGGASGNAVGGETASELRTLYQQEVLKECAPTVTGKYPFTPGGGDAPPGDVAKLFGQGGTFDTFFSTRLATSVDPRNPSQWKTDDTGRAVGGPPSMLQRFQAAKEIKDMLSPPGSGGTLAFTLTPLSFDPAVKQVIVQVDSQTQTLRPNQQLPAHISWSPVSSAFASITIEGAAPIEERGPWALLRLFDRAQVDGTGGRAMVTFRANGRDVRLQLDAAYGKNPITSKSLLRFQCAI